MYIISLKLYLQIKKIFEDSLFKKVKAIRVSNIPWQVVVYFRSSVGERPLASRKPALWQLKVILLPGVSYMYF